MINRMAKPEEVLIVEDENGNIVRETMKDNDVLVQYKIMRETLIYLSHLDHDDTEKQVQCHHDDTGLCVLICEILRISSLMIKYAFYQMSFSLL
jgi:hypothetical protein